MFGATEKWAQRLWMTLRLDDSTGFQRLWCGLLCVLNAEVHAANGWTRIWWAALNLVRKTGIFSEGRQQEKGDMGDE